MEEKLAEEGLCRVSGKCTRERGVFSVCIQTTHGKDTPLPSVFPWYTANKKREISPHAGKFGRGGTALAGRGLPTWP